MAKIIGRTGSIGRSATILALLTVFIKMVGFIKQAVISYYFGASASMDSYLVVTDFISEIGVMFFSSIAITVITIYDEEKARDGANSFISNTYVGLLCFTIVLILLIEAFATPILKMLAPGFSQEMIAMATQKLRLVVILLLTICISNISIAVLNAEKEFTSAKSIGLIQSFSIILSCVALANKIDIAALYVGFSVYYFIENLYLILKIRKFISFQPHQPFHDNRVRKLLRLSLPVFISSAIVQINAMIDKAIASYLEAGSVSAMSYGHYVFSTIQSIIIASVTTVLYSYFSKYVVDKDESAIVQKTRNSILLLLLLIIPICLCCCVNSNEIIRLIYGRGTFDSNAVSITGRAFLGYSIGLVFIAVRDVYIQVLYAYQRTKAAMINGICGVMVNVTLSILLSSRFGVFGIAIADSIAYLLLAFMSYRSAHRVLPLLKSGLPLHDFLMLLICAVPSICGGLLVYKLLQQSCFLFRLAGSSVVILLLFYMPLFTLHRESATIVKSFLTNKIHHNDSR